MRPPFSLLSITISAFAGACTSDAGPPWSEQAAFHSLLVASVYQAEIKAVIVRIAIPGASPEEIETSVAEPLERRILTLGDVRSVRSTASDGQFRLEVQFTQPPGAKELDEVRLVVDQFWRSHTTGANGDMPTVSLDRASKS